MFALLKTRNQLHDTNNPPNDAQSDLLISVDGSTPSNENSHPLQPAETLEENGAVFSSQPGYTSTEIDLNPDKERGWCPGGGIISVTDLPSSEPCLHEYVNALGCCNDCGMIIEEPDDL